MDDFGFGSDFGGGGFDLFGGDTPDFGTSYDFGGDFGSLYGDGGFGGDLMSQFSLGFSPQLDTSGLGGYTAPSMPAPVAPQPAPQMGGGGGLPMGGQGGFGSMLPGLLGLGGGLASMIGTIAGGGMGPKPQMSVPQKAALNQAYGANQQLGQFATGQTPLQMQQAGMLQALANGQIPQNFSNLVARAYDPQYQDVARRATEAGRQAGFYDSPMTSPVGGAIVGPAAAQLQGQQAQSLLGLMQSLPGLYTNPIQQQMSAAQGQAGGFTNLGGQYPVQQQQNIAPLLGNQIGSGLQGLGQAIGQNQQQTQQQQFQNSLLQAINRQRQGPYEFGGYSGV